MLSAVKSEEEMGGKEKKLEEAETVEKVGTVQLQYLSCYKCNEISHFNQTFSRMLNLHFHSMSGPAIVILVIHRSVCVIDRKVCFLDLGIVNLSLDRSSCYLGDRNQEGDQQENNKCERLLHFVNVNVSEKLTANVAAISLFYTKFETKCINWREILNPRKPTSIIT